MHLKISSAKWRPFCLGLNELIIEWNVAECFYWQVFAIDISACVVCPWSCIFLNENVWFSLEISFNFVRNVRINKISALVQILAWHIPGNMPLSEPMVVNLLTHICVTRPQWLNRYHTCYSNGTDRRKITRATGVYCEHFAENWWCSPANRLRWGCFLFDHAISPPFNTPVAHVTLKSCHMGILQCRSKSQPLL